MARKKENSGAEKGKLRAENAETVDFSRREAILFVYGRTIFTVSDIHRDTDMELPSWITILRP